MRTATALTFAAALFSTGCTQLGLDPMVVEGQARLEMDPGDAMDFGNVSPQGTAAIDEMFLISAGEESVAIIDIYLGEYTSSAFSVRSDLSFLPMRLEPGADLPVKLDFAPYAMGQYEGEVVVWVDNEGTTEEYFLPLYGNGCPDSNQDGSCD